jgi:hypothetical protein
MTNLNGLPEELQLLIIDFLDSPAPSSSRLRREPSLALTDSEDTTLKRVSLSSRRWRRLVLPTLFKYTRLRLDRPPSIEWTSCPSCNAFAITTGGIYTSDQLVPECIDQYHVDMAVAANSHHGGSRSFELSDLGTQTENGSTFGSPPSPTLAWIPRFYHAARDFITFLSDHDLTKLVDNFVLYTDRMLEAKLHRFPHEAADKDWRFPASAAFWAHLLAVIDPTTITILAPPLDLACLTNCAVDTFGDWAFGEMDFHILTLRQAKSGYTTTGLPTYSSLCSIPTSYPSIAASSILNLRPWTHLGLNEGPFLKAYGTYEFFERGPPSLVYSIKDSIVNRPRRAQASAQDQTNLAQPLWNLTSLDYTAIFPFSNHADFSSILHQISHLSLQLAPGAESNILNDRVRLGKADLADCWTELLTTYAQLVEPLASVRRPVGVSAGSADVYGVDFAWDTNKHDVALRKLVALDFRIKAMQDDLDELFTPLCLPVWVETPTGVFTRMLQGGQDR